MLASGGINKRAQTISSYRTTQPDEAGEVARGRELIKTEKE